jgi:hypothetical protein
MVNLFGEKIFKNVAAKNFDINIFLIFMGQLKKSDKFQRGERIKKQERVAWLIAQQPNRGEQPQRGVQIQRSEQIQPVQIRPEQLDEVSNALEKMLTDLNTLGPTLIKYLQQASVNPNFRLLFKSFKSYEQFLFIQKVFKLELVQQHTLLEIMNLQGRPNEEKKNQYDLGSFVIKDVSIDMFADNYNILLPLLTSLLEEHNKKKSYNNQEKSKLEVMNLLFNDINLNDLTSQKFEILLSLIRFHRNMASRILNINLTDLRNQKEFIKEILIEWGKPSLEEFTKLRTFLELNEMSDLKKMQSSLSKQSISKELISNYPELTLNEASLIDSILKIADIKKIQSYIVELLKKGKDPKISVNLIESKWRTDYLVENFVKPILAERIPKIINGKKISINN